MKTAILLATRKGDKRAAKVLRHDIYSKVLADFKARVREGRGEPGYDSIEIWTGPPAKKYARFASDVTEPVVTEPVVTDDQPVTVPVTDIASPVETLPITEPAGSDLIPEASPGSMSPRRGRS